MAGLTIFLELSKFEVTAVLNEGTYNLLCYWLLVSPWSHDQILNVAASIHLQMQMDLNCPNLSPPMPFWPLYSAARYPNWPSPSSCSHCWLKHAQSGLSQVSSWLYKAFFPKLPMAVFSQNLRKMVSHGRQLLHEGPDQAHLISSRNKKISWDSGVQSGDCDNGWARMALALCHTAQLGSALCCKKLHAALWFRGYLLCTKKPKM